MLPTRSELVKLPEIEWSLTTSSPADDSRFCRLYISAARRYSDAGVGGSVTVMANIERPRLTFPALSSPTMRIRTSLSLLQNARLDRDP